MLKYLFVGLIAAFLGAVAAQAETREDGLVTIVQLSDLEAAMQQWEYEISQSFMQGDTPVIFASDENGTDFIIYGTACNSGDQSGCLGVMMTVIYDVSVPLELATVNQANKQWAAATTTYSRPDAQTGEGELSIHRYIILDGGVTSQNLRDNLVNLLAIAPQVVEFLEQ